MRSQSKGIGSADIDASICHKIRTIPALLHCASHWQDNARVIRQSAAEPDGHGVDSPVTPGVHQAEPRGA